MLIDIPRAGVPQHANRLIAQKRKAGPDHESERELKIARVSQAFDDVGHARHADNCPGEGPVEAALAYAAQVSMVYTFVDCGVTYTTAYISTLATRRKTVVFLRHWHHHCCVY